MSIPISSTEDDDDHCDADGYGDYDDEHNYTDGDGCTPGF